jgi:hypothetical protein
MADIIKHMTNNVEDGKTVLNQYSAIGTTPPMSPTGEPIYFSFTSVMTYGDLNPPSSR